MILMNPKTILMNHLMNPFDEPPTDRRGPILRNPFDEPFDELLNLNLKEGQKKALKKDEGHTDTLLTSQAKQDKRKTGL